MASRKFLNNYTSVAHTAADSKPEEEVCVNHVPFKLEYEGPANVDTKFTCNSVKVDTSSEVLFNQFRGRPLHGRKLTLPENYEGLIATDLRKSDRGLDEGNSESDISLVKRFDTITYWNWDRVPSGMDKHVKLMDWIEISEALHEPI